MRKFAFAAMGLVCLSAFGGTPTTTTSKPAPLVPTTQPAQVPLHRQIDAAMKKGLDRLLRMQLPDGSWEGFGKDPNTGVYAYPCGPTALAVYALLESGTSAQDPAIAKALDWLTAQQSKESKLDPRVLNRPGAVYPRTYEVAFRCCVWVLANRTTNNRYTKQLQHDAKLLETSVSNGAYGYDAAGVSAVGDNSNSQSGMMGMLAAWRGGYEVETVYWQRCLRHWQESQRADGGWGYVNGVASSGTMTAGGLASVLALYERLYYKEFRNCKTAGSFTSIERASVWLDKQFAKALKGKDSPIYFLYNVQRLTMASGQKFFGTTDWFKVGAQTLLKAQAKDGSFKGDFGPTVDTSLALLFLVQGNRGVGFAKLQFSSVAGPKLDENDWNCRPNDVALLTAWINNAILCMPTLRWQTFSIETPVEDWHDARILYISGSKAPDFKPEDIEKLRTFVLQGGTIFSVSACDSKATFGTAMKKFYSQMFPEYPMAKLDPRSPIYTMSSTQLNGIPELQWITNGVRPLVIHCDTDVARAWQMNTIASDKKLFQLGANLLQYVCDTGPRLPRGAAVVWPAQAKASDTVITIGRVKWGGRWNVEPLALTRLSRLMKLQTGIDVQPIEVDAAKAAECNAAVLVISGIGALDLTPQETRALKKYVTNGGTLLVDAAGGNEDFAKTAIVWAESLGKVVPLGPGDKVFNLKTVADGKIGNLSVRPATRERLGLANPTIAPRLRGMSVGQRTAVFYSREDISNAGLVGYQSYGVDGYDPDGNLDSAAYRLMRNIVLYAAEESNLIKPPPPPPAPVK